VLTAAATATMGAGTRQDIPRAATASGQISTTVRAAAFRTHDGVTENNCTTIDSNEWYAIG
jgi:hypothetical protein